MRVALPTDFTARLSSASKDARMINGMKEAKEGGAVVLNRPGTFSTGYNYTSLQGAGVGAGVGAGGLLYAIYDDTFALNETLWYPGSGWITGEGVWYGGEFWEAISDVPVGASAPTEGAYWTKVVGIGNFFWNPYGAYDYDDYVWEVDPATGRMTKAYAQSPSADLQRPFQPGWRGGMWGRDKLMTTDRYSCTGAGIHLGGEPPTSVTTFGNTAAGSACAWLASAQISDSDDSGNTAYFNDPYIPPAYIGYWYSSVEGGTIFTGYYDLAPVKIA